MEEGWVEVKKPYISFESSINIIWLFLYIFESRKFKQKMTAGLEFEVIPENCLRNEQIELILGMPINQVITSIQNVSRQIKNVELVYCNKVGY